MSGAAWPGDISSGSPETYLQPAAQDVLPASIQSSVAPPAFERWGSQPLDGGLQPVLGDAKSWTSGAAWPGDTSSGPPETYLQPATRDLRRYYTQEGQQPSPQPTIYAMQTGSQSHSPSDSAVPAFRRFATAGPPKSAATTSNNSQGLVPSEDPLSWALRPLPAQLGEASLAATRRPRPTPVEVEAALQAVLGPGPPLAVLASAPAPAAPRVSDKPSTAADRGCATTAPAVFEDPLIRASGTGRDVCGTGRAATGTVGLRRPSLPHGADQVRLESSELDKLAQKDAIIEQLRGEIERLKEEHAVVSRSDPGEPGTQNQWHSLGDSVIAATTPLQTEAFAGWDTPQQSPSLPSSPARKEVPPLCQATWSSEWSTAPDMGFRHALPLSHEETFDNADFGIWGGKVAPPDSSPPPLAPHLSTAGGASSTNAFWDPMECSRHSTTMESSHIPTDTAPLQAARSSPSSAGVDGSGGSAEGFLGPWAPPPPQSSAAQGGGTLAGRMSPTAADDDFGSLPNATPAAHNGSIFQSWPTSDGNLWTVDIKRLARYEAAFRKADRNQDGFVEAAEAREVLNKSRLGGDELSQVLLLADVDQDGRLTPGEFVCAMHLAYRRSKDGAPLPSALPPELAAFTSPPPDLGVSDAGGDAAGVVAESTLEVRRPPPSVTWAAGEEELRNYRNIFLACVDPAATGYAAPGEAKKVLERSSLPVEELSRIWQLSDMDGDGNLSLREFLCAMVIAARRLQGAPLPAAVPPELLDSLVRSLSQSRTVPREALHDDGEGPSALDGLSNLAVAAVSSTSAAFTSDATQQFLRAPPEEEEEKEEDVAWAPSVEELEHFRAIHERVAGRGGDGTIGPDAGREMLERSGLPTQELSHIWRLSDIDGDGRLARSEFICAMVLAMRRKQGFVLPLALPSKLEDLVSTPTHTASTPAGDAVWDVTTEEVERYHATFRSIDVAGTGAIGPDEGRQVLESSQLPLEELEYIWELSDVSANGFLSLGEFICAMALVARRRQGLQLPPSLPPELEKVLGRPGGSQGTSPKLQMAVNASTASFMGTPDGRSVGASAARATEALWTPSPQEVDRCREIFRAKDPSGSGYMGPDDARDLLEKSQLPVPELLRIWRLADVDQDGHLTLTEFVCAMALAVRRQQGVELPSVLPPGLVAAAVAANGFG